MILLNFTYLVSDLKVGDLVEVEADDNVIIGLTARKVKKIAPTP
jgi:hypothetical protein